MTRTATIALAFVLALLVPASAERGNAELKRYCTGDATTFCSGMDPGGKEMEACFKKHRKELSENCRRAIDAYHSKDGK